MADSKDERQHEIQLDVVDPPEFDKVHWTKEPGLRKLYFYAAILMVASATTGYDGYVIIEALEVLSRCTDRSKDLY